MRRNVIQLGLVWLTAFNLRVILFAIPPSLPAIRSELGLSFSVTGSITSLAVLMLGVASIPGALQAVRHALATRRAELVLVVQPPAALDPSGRTAALLRRDYRRVARVGGATVYRSRNQAT